MGMWVSVSPLARAHPPHSGGSQILFNREWGFCASLPTRYAVALSKSVHHHPRPGSLSLLLVSIL